MSVIGIIGGSGLDDPDILKDATLDDVDTPFGKPSGPLAKGRMGGINVVLLPRHGTRHQFSPTQVNNRANIHALKEAGVTHILATTACGSLRRKIDRGHFVIIDQFIDFTRFRKNTFYDSFENGAKHTAMPEPFDANLRKVLYTTSTELDNPTHNHGTVVTIEGPGSQPEPNRTCSGRGARISSTCPPPQRPCWPTKRKYPTPLWPCPPIMTAGKRMKNP